MALDIREGYKIIEKKIESTQIYNKTAEDIDNLKRRSGDSLELLQSSVSESLSNAKKKTDNFQKGVENAKSQFDKMIDLTNLLSFGNNKDGGSKTTKYLKRIFVNTIEQLKPKIKEYFNELGTKAIGCSENQEYIPNTSLYIRLESIDYSGLLKGDPTSLVGKISYEKSGVTYNNYPFSMNKELYNRTQNINQPYSVPATTDYLGKSTQNLFDITYVESYTDPVTNQVIVGNFFKVDLKPRQNNLVTEFLKDYYETIDIFDFKNLFAQLMNQLTGAVSIEKGDGDSALSDWYKFTLVMKRILGLCYDSTTEIDVSGKSKISENDNVDDSYFEFDEVDLRLIDQQISDVKLGVVEFEECNTVKVPVDSISILNAINNLNFVPGSNNNNEITDASNLTDVVTNGFYPLSINIDLSFLKKFPIALVMSILTPKVMLPIIVLSKSLGKTFVDEINSYLDMAKKLKTFFVELVTKITSLFVQIIFDIIIKDIKLLVKRLYDNIFKEKVDKYQKIILSLTALLVQIADIVRDIRECKSVINKLQQLLTDIQQRTNEIPFPLLLASRLRKGFSKTSAFLRVIQEFEAAGLPTGPMPDGSPNLMLVAAKSIINGIDDEMSENGRTDIALLPLTVLPIGTTTPQKIYGIPI